MQNSQLEKFLHRARRTWTKWTIAEHAGLGLLCGCSCVLLLLPILLWRGERGQSLAIVFPLIGTAMGIAMGLRARPNLQTVAQFADQRFHTSDLLATAYALRDSADPWHAAILNLADTRVLELSPAALTPHRLGPRAWSGIFLSFIAAITLGLLSVTMPAGQAQAAAAPANVDSPADWAQRHDAAPAIAQQSAAGREAKAEAAPDSQSMTNTDDGSPTKSTLQQSNSSNRDGQAVRGLGGGPARTYAPDLAMPSNHVNSAGNESADSRNIAAAGQGGEVHSRLGGGAIAGQVSTSQGPAPAPWSAPDWPAAQAAASQAIQAGQIPDAYRNLVRDYFDRADPDVRQ
jgi:hypothetical protein